MNEAHDTAAIMAFIDAGLFPFQTCTSCVELMPVSIKPGPFRTISVSCCRCGTTGRSGVVRFLTSAEARRAGWVFEERPTDAN